MNCSVIRDDHRMTRPNFSAREGKFEPQQRARFIGKMTTVVKPMNPEGNKPGTARNQFTHIFHRVKNVGAQLNDIRFNRKEESPRNNHHEPSRGRDRAEPV